MSIKNKMSKKVKKVQKKPNGLQQSQPLNLFSWDGHFDINTCKLAIAVKNDIRNFKKV